jgi:hypothetical protein
MSLPQWFVGGLSPGRPKLIGKGGTRNADFGGVPLLCYRMEAVTYGRKIVRFAVKWDK